jgi:hypothetical protein
LEPEFLDSAAAFAGVESVVDFRGVEVAFRIRGHVMEDVEMNRRCAGVEKLKNGLRYRLARQRKPFLNSYDSTSERGLALVA